MSDFSLEAEAALAYAIELMRARTTATGQRRPRAKYQVFISSTYVDLHEERRLVTWEILKARHIPAGMENFTATDDRGWRTIERTIGLSDYYIVIVAGLYGSVDATTGVSWTEREYRYARDRGMRILAFIRDTSFTTADKTETNHDLRTRLDALKLDLRTNHLCETWTTADDLKSKVIQALRNQIIEDEDSESPRPGWFRGDEIATSPTILEEFARLSSENARLIEIVDSLQNASSGSLQLVDESGSELGARTATVHQVIVHGNEAYDVLGVSREEANRYANDSTLAVWLNVDIRNSGTKPARNVVVDFHATNVDKVFLHKIERPQGVIARYVKPHYLDPAEHVYVESWSVKEGLASVRQRVRQVAAGGDESLISIGLRPKLDRAFHELVINVEYTARSEDGVVTTGNFAISVEVGETIELSYPEAMGGHD